MVFLNISIFLHLCVCVCVCVCEREREREADLHMFCVIVQAVGELYVMWVCHPAENCHYRDLCTNSLSKLPKVHFSLSFCLKFMLCAIFPQDLENRGLCKAHIFSVAGVQKSETTSEKVCFVFFKMNTNLCCFKIYSLLFVYLFIMYVYK